MQKIQEILKVVMPEKVLSVKEVLATYSHIDLTEDEIDEAILQAKIKKQAILNYNQELLRIEARRNELMKPSWDYDVTRNFMRSRAEQLFNGRFILDEHNFVLFNLLSLYYSEDKSFISEALALGISNPSLQKGILLAGKFGVGKTWMMQLFQKNKRCCYKISNSKDLSGEFNRVGQEVIDAYSQKPKNAVNDASVFFQPFLGLCIDDMGTEEIKNNYGNRSNVIQDILELRYSAQNTGIYLHATTNLCAKGIHEQYGGRVASRCKEIFNIIELRGADRRK